VAISDTSPATVLPVGASELAAQVAGPVFLPGDDGYVEEAGIYNLSLVLEPALIVGVTSEADVQAAVRFAARRQMPVAVKSTGHQVARPGHGALLISTQRMSAVIIDPDNRTARIGPGVRWEQVIDEAAEFGLAPMNGSSPTVGAIGYTLGGGQSVAWSRSKGYAADHVLSLDVVTADGRLRHVTADNDPELFWALRGGKDNFGVVTAMVCELFPQAEIYGGGVWFAIHHVAEVMPAWREWLETLPEEATTAVAVQHLPPVPDLPAPLRGASVLHLRFTHLGSPVEGRRLFAPMRAIAPSILDTVSVMPYKSIGTVYLDPPEPTPYWDRGTMLTGLPKQALDEFVALTGPDSGSPLLSVEIRQLGGAMDRQPTSPNAVPTRGLPFVMFAYGVGGPEEEELMRGYLAKLISGMEPWSADRKMINFLSADEGTDPEELRAVYGEQRYERLARIKKTYDPLNLFRMNHNIPPLRSGAAVPLSPPPVSD
jgi:FAD binding domain/Berberine and berberine like